MLSNLSASIRRVSSTVANKRDFGTAFAIYADSEATYFLTCMHVVENVGGPDCVMIDGNCNIEVRAWRLPEDLAILRMRDGSEYPVLTLGGGGSEGDPFVGYGWQELSIDSYELSPFSGKLGKRVDLESRAEPGRAKAWRIELESGSTLRRGNSGAPLIEPGTGKVIGIVRYMAGEGQEGIAVSADVVARVWQDRPPGVLASQEVAVPDKRQGARARSSSLSGRITERGYWQSLEHAAIQAVTAGGMAAMTLYRQAEMVAGRLARPGDPGEEQERNPSIAADFRATAAMFQVMDAYLDSLALRLGCPILYLGEETAKHEEDWLALIPREIYPRERVRDRVSRANEFFAQGVRGFRVIIDAIDGTGSFKHGIPLFCTGLAILVDDQVRVSAIYDPVRHTIYYGVLKGPDAAPAQDAEAWALHVPTGTRTDLVHRTRMSEPLKPSDRALGIHLTRTKSDKLHQFLAPEPATGRCQLERLATTFNGIYALNSGMLAMAEVARGALGGFVNNVTNPWDIAAGEVLIRACGGRVTDMENRPIDYTTYDEEDLPSCVAANDSQLHWQILGVLAG